MKKETKQKKGNEAQKAFKNWKKKKYPIYNSSNEELKLEPDECFVTLWDYTYKSEAGKIKPEFKRTHFVSNYGKVLSFYNPESPLWLKESYDKESGYWTVNDWKVHRLVWLSFAAKNLKEKKPIQGDSFGIKFTKTLKTITDDEQVHHKDTDRHNNKLSNLELLPSKAHELLNKLKKKKTDREEIDTIRKANLDSYEDDPANKIIIVTPSGTQTGIQSKEKTEDFTNWVKDQLSNMVLTKE